MTQVFPFRGAVFDLDDTLLDNEVGTLGGLHARSRLAAIHELGERRGIEELTLISEQENLDAFLTAKEHTIEAAVWKLFYLKGIVLDEEIDRKNDLLHEILLRKHELYSVSLREEGKEVPGAKRFIQLLSINGLADQLAIASGSLRCHIKFFLEKAGISQFFPDDQIISYENITNPKPHPQAFELAFRTLGLPDDQRDAVLVFEDDVRGVRSAKAAGLYTCAITTRFNQDTFAGLDVPPDLIADSFAEFAEKLGLSGDVE